MQRICTFLKKFNYIFSRRERGALAGLLVLIIIGALLETATVAMMLPFMYAVLDADVSAESGWMMCVRRLFHCRTSYDLIIAVSLILAGLYIVRALYILMLTTVRSRFIAKTRSAMSARLFDCILNKPWHYHLTNTTAETQRAVTMDVNRLFTLLENMMNVASSLFTAVTLLAVLMFVSPGLTLFAAAMILGAMLLVNKVVIHKIRIAGVEDKKQNTLMMKWVHQSIGGLKGIKVNRREQMFVNRYAEHAAEYAHVGSNYTIYSDLPKILTDMISMVGIFVFMALMCGRGANLESLLPTFATFALAAVRLLPMINGVNRNLNSIRYHRVALDTMYQTLTESRVVMKNVELFRPERPVTRTEPLREGIRVEHVSFHYEGAANSLYDDISLSIPAGKSVAFIGFTGSGKTTLADIILGLHTPDSGRILADGHDIHREPDWWADRVGYIPQSIYICEDTIRSNVAFGIAPEEVDDGRVWECLADAQLKEFVEHLPERLDTMCGENGIRFSGGQRQRIGIARALYIDPPFLVLDEATSSLDNDTEAAIIDTINRLSRDKTLLIIAHRLTTIRGCDLIYRVEHGTATAVSHAELSG